MTETAAFWAVIPAAGAGRRMGGAVPKQYLPLAGRLVIEHTLARFIEHPKIAGVVVAVDANDDRWPSLKFSGTKPLMTVTGGRERCHSVLNALKHLQNVARGDDWVLVHDAARPCLSAEDLDKMITTLAGDPVGGILAAPVRDTLKRAGAENRIDQTVDRTALWHALTPQMFRLSVLCDAVASAIEADIAVTDEAAAVERTGLRPRLVEGRVDNIKITHRQDLALAERVLILQAGLPLISSNSRLVRKTMEVSMISPDKKQEVLSRIRHIENFIISGGDENVAIGAFCSAITAKSFELTKSLDSLMPILRTALVINWPESAMKSRYDRFVTMFPDISTLSDLKRIIDSTDPLNFCKRYLHINANPLAPDKNPKYSLLRELTNGFLEYQKLFGLSTEIEAIRHWSERVNLSDLKNDFIGKRRGIGRGVVENIRLNLGGPVIKPDRHVIGVMKDFLQLEIPLDGYSQFARFIGKNPRYLDCILFEFGKANKISA